MNKELEPFTPKIGAFGRAFASASNPRRHRWRAYLAACRRIPKNSPVAGSTSFDRLNERRLLLIELAAKNDSWKELDADPEFQALQRATSEWLCGPLVCDNLVMARYLRHLKRKYGEC